MKEGSVLLAALALASTIAYWSDHFRGDGWQATPPDEGAFARQPPLHPTADAGFAPPRAERLEVASAAAPADRAALCVELQEVIQGVDAALQVPQSPATAEQLNARRRVYSEKRMGLGC